MKMSWKLEGLFSTYQQSFIKISYCFRELHHFQKLKKIESGHDEATVPASVNTFLEAAAAAYDHFLKTFFELLKMP